MEYSVDDKNINDLRSCRISVSKSPKNIKRIKKILEDNNLEIGIIEKIEKENKKLGILKNKKVMLDFLIDDSDEKNLTVKSDIKLKILEFNDELCRIQRRLEEDLRNMEDI